MINKAITFRIISSVFGALINIYVASVLLNFFGHDYFATYVLITSLPLLMLWADFGLGTLIMNTFIDANRNLLSPEIVKKRINFSFYFILIMGLFCLIILLIGYEIRGLIWRSSENLTIEIILCFVVIGITTFAVPFSLGAKKLQADGEYLQVIKIQSFIPFFISLLTLIVTHFLPSFKWILILVPSIVYFFNTFFIFFKSGLGAFLTAPKTFYLDKHSSQYIRLGFWSLVLTTIIGLTFQLPKYLIYFFKTNLDVSTYGLQSLLIIPGISFLAIPGLMTIPKFREAYLDKEMNKIFRETLAKTRLTAIVLAFVTALLIPFQAILHLEIITSSQILQVCLLLVFAPSWMLPALTVTEVPEIRKVAQRFLVVMFSAILVTYILRNANSFWLLTGYFSTVYVGYSISVSQKLKKFSL